MKSNNKDHCFYCERIFSDSLPPDYILHGIPLLRTRDHIIPLSKGGSNHYSNKVACCHQCNKLKADNMPEDFIILLHLKASNKNFHGYTKKDFYKIIANTITLIETIKPRREKLFRKDSRPPQLARPIKQVVQQLNSPPANAVQAKSKAELLEKFKKTYPYMFNYLYEFNNDMPRWIIDNLVDEKFMK